NRAPARSGSCRMTRYGIAGQPAIRLTAVLVLLRSFRCRLRICRRESARGALEVSQLVEYVATQHEKRAAFAAAKLGKAIECVACFVVQPGIPVRERDQEQPVRGVQMICRKLVDQIVDRLELVNCDCSEAATVTRNPAGCRANRPLELGARRKRVS